MAFATINSDFSYWQKQTKPLFEDLLWNIPEQKISTINVIGGNSQNFHSIIRTAEFLSSHFPLRQVSIVLPSALQRTLPPLPNVNFVPSTDSGSFAKSDLLNLAFSSSNFSILAGDLSKNSATAIAFTTAISKSLTDASDIKPLLITRDSVDLLAESSAKLFEHPNLFIVASLAQIQKLFRALYYPKMIMLSQPLIPIIETLHKFTLTYDKVTLLTFHQDNIIVAHAGKITTTNIIDTDFSPLSLWGGTLAATVAALNLFNPQRPLEATTAAILYR